MRPFNGRYFYLYSILWSGGLTGTRCCEWSGEMNKLKNYSSWAERYEGTGTNVSIWLQGSEGQQVLFKYRKSDVSGEHWAEKLASDIANLIGIGCAHIELGTYNGKIGACSYRINKVGEEIHEGLEYIIVKYRTYDEKKLEDLKGNYYTLGMILDCLPKGENILIDFLKILIFDFLIGNSDRHARNWALLYKKNEQEISICPVYDNGSSFCCQETDEKLERMKKDNNWFNASVTTKSRSIIKLENSKKKEPTHQQVMMHLKDHYYNETIGFVKEIKVRLTDERIDDILQQYPSDIIKEHRKSFLKRFIKRKKQQLLDIYDMEGA